MTITRDSRARSLVLPFLLLGAACGEVEDPPDASTHLDAALPDAANPDATAPDAGSPDGAPSDAEPAGTIALYSGSTGGVGNLDGPRGAARFLGPSGVARAADGTLFVADSSNYTIRKISPEGTVSTLAGKPGEPGTSDGTGSEARFLLPVSLVIAPGGDLIVSDAFAGTLRRVTPEGAVSTWAGQAEVHGGTDGPRRDARFRSPEGLAFDGDGNLYVADRDASTIRRIDPSGEVSTHVGADLQAGHADGPRASARLDGPFGVAVSAEGLIAIADSGNNVIRLVTATGTVSTLAGTPGLGQDTQDGLGPAARFGRPRALVFEPSGDLIVADTFNDRLRHITPAGVVTTYTGSTAGSRDGPLAEASFSFPSGLLAATEDGSEVLYVAEVGSSILRRIVAGQVTTFAGQAFELELRDGPAASARFFGPSGMLLLPDGAVLVTDMHNHALRRVSPDGRAETVAGEPSEPALVDGPLAEARFEQPRALLDDRAGGYYVADLGNHVIRHVSAAGEVTTFAGGPIGRGMTHLDGPRLEARFLSPGPMVMDSVGNIYFTDFANHDIRKIDLSGMVSTVAGEGLPGYLDGDGEAARFNGPDGLVLIDDHTLLVADSLNSVLRRVELDEAGATVSTYAGRPPVDEQEQPGSADGLGSAASFRQPRGLLRDGGSVLVADSNNSLIRRVSLENAEVTTAAGTRGWFGLRAGPLPGTLFEPQTLLRLEDGRVLVTSIGAISIVEGL